MLQNHYKKKGGPTPCGKRRGEANSKKTPRPTERRRPKKKKKRKMGKRARLERRGPTQPIKKSLGKRKRDVPKAGKKGKAGCTVYAEERKKRKKPPKGGGKKKGERKGPPWTILNTEKRETPKGKGKGKENLSMGKNPLPPEKRGGRGERTFRKPRQRKEKKEGKKKGGTSQRKKTNKKKKKDARNLIPGKGEKKEKEEKDPVGTACQRGRKFWEIYSMLKEMGKGKRR